MEVAALQCEGRILEGREGNSLRRRAVVHRRDGDVERAREACVRGVGDLRHTTVVV